MDASMKVSTLNVQPLRPSGGSESQGKVSLAPAGAEAVSAARMGDGAAETARQAEKAAEQVGQAVDRINDFVQVVQRDLEFSVHDDTGRTVVRVFDTNSEELVRQFPADEILALAEQLDRVRGLLVSDQA
ncbi:flagellar protein FlaG [Alkalilimnicola ehrlichii MLHE-1]|uniref:Flagellar protein FlaG protein n=1 Tax=Alkalilimnicola ehrlichii (strain ATCC BAA-1101 / DSM 17681 / MLHE-1) TaxID=187272 RepID=Q0AAT2_ALKEH|nr:flagellar protein FlaG [Alkalilimnicola ehrlichii]ABI56055.1 flagellar protein FlaG protein [Alkalilimnicola ehrlichii MLHE-1]